MIRCLFISFACAGTPLAAQTWQGVTVGAPLPDAMAQTQTDPPNPHERWAAYCARRWVGLPDGTRLRVINTVGCDGPVATIYISSELSNPDAAPAGYQRLVLGRTTLPQVVSQLGSNGLTGGGYGGVAEGALDYTLLYDVEGSDTRVLFNFMATDLSGRSSDLVPRDQAWLSSVEMMTRDFFAIRTGAFPFAPSAGYSAIPDLFE